MKQRIYKLTILMVLVLFTGLQQANAQSTKGVDKAFKKAAAEYNALKYVSAIPKLLDVLKLDPDNVKAQEMIAYSYKMIKNYTQALIWYEALSKQKKIDPKWALYYAEALANVQQYESSEGWYRKYATLTPTDRRASSFASTSATNFNKNIGNWKVTFTNLNSLGDDYAPAYYKEGLIFSSNRKTKRITKTVYGWNNTPFTDIYKVASLKDIKDIDADSLLSSGQALSKKDYVFNDDDTAPTSNDSRTLGDYNPSIERDTMAMILSKKISISPIDGNINTKFHEAAPAVFPNGSIIFTRNNHLGGSTQTSKEGINKLKLYIASGSGLDKITPFPYNSNEYSVGHPTLTKDGKILIFASDMPNGFGGTDLYYSVRSESGQWTRPVNLGKNVNTEGNEMFPFLDNDNSLYFASTGHPGLGGLDLFEVDLKEMKPTSAPRNMGVPINSPTDDFALIRSEDGRSGFFSSNRRGNDDIYRFSRSTYRIILEGTVTDARTRLPLAGSRILMRHLDGTDTLRTDSKGHFRREMPREMDYETTAQKIGYVNSIGFVSSLGITQDTVIKLDLKLNKTENAQQYVLNNCDSLKKVFAVQNIYYDLDRYEIRPDAKPALDELVALMRKYPEITVLTSSHCDSRASEEYNRRLSLNRGGTAKAYLVSKGIAASRIKIEYYGKTRLVNRCFDGVPCSEADQQLNRRTEFDVILNGVNITRQNCNDK